jgi:hypothetical protein
MQVWDQVVCIGGKYENQAGLVIRVDNAASVATVKLDSLDDPVDFRFAELKFLGR